MARHEEGFLSAPDSLRLFWVQDLPEAEPTAFIGIVHGMGDHIGRYRSAIDAFNAAGFGVLGFDYRGHGKSGGRRGHVDRFSDYVGDLKAFWAKLTEAAGGKPVFLLPHSHGGLIAAHWLRGLSKPEAARLQGVVYTSPYFALGFTPPAITVAVAGFLSNIVPFLPIASGLKYEALSTDEAWQKETERDPLYGKKVTPRWFTEHRTAQQQALEFAPSLGVATLVLTASDDTIAAVPMMRKYFDALGATDKQYKEHSGMRHELLNERARGEVYREIVRWISTHL